MSTSRPTPRPPLTDSPLFWLFVFGGMGLIALMVVGPRYAHRQARLERMDQARRDRAWQPQGYASQSANPTADDGAAPQTAAPQASSPSLLPIVYVVGAVLAVAAALAACKGRPAVTKVSTAPPMPSAPAAFPSRDARNPQDASGKGAAVSRESS